VHISHILAFLAVLNICCSNFRPICVSVCVFAICLSEVKYS